MTTIAPEREQQIIKEMKKLAKRATYFADQTRTPRGSEPWIAEFTNVLEGGRPRCRRSS